MIFWCLPASTHIATRSSVRPLTADELNKSGIKQKTLDLDQKIQEKIEDNVKNKEIDSPGLSINNTFRLSIYLE